MSYSKVNWQDLPSTTTPINASNLNKMDNQIELNDTNITSLDGRITTAEGDIETLEGINEYSTTEQVIGKWYNGKPLYRKIIEVNSLPNTTSMNIAYNISNLEYVAKISGLATNAAKTVFFPIPFYRRDGSLGIEIYGTSANIVIVTGTDRTELSAYIEVQYTKTTDSAS